MKIGDRIRIFRKINKITISELAAYLNISAPTLRKMEKNQLFINMDIINLLTQNPNFDLKREELLEYYYDQKLEKELLLKLLIEDKPFSLIKKELGVNKNYNLKSLCEYLGKKYLRAYELHINNITKSSEITLVNDENLTKADFLKGMDLILSKIQNPEKDKILIENTAAEKSNTNSNTFNEDVYEIIQLPKILPIRLQGENYVVKQTSVKVVDNVWQEFQQFVKANKTYSSIEYLSLAILEFLEKYRLH